MEAATNPTRQANIDRIRERVNAIKNADIIEIDLNNNQEENEPLNRQQHQTSSGGAFKLYNNDNTQENDDNDDEEENSQTRRLRDTNNVINNKQETEARRLQQSPFISIETTMSNQKHTGGGRSNSASGGGGGDNANLSSPPTPSKKPASTATTTTKKTRGPIRKYRSGSTSALNVKTTTSKNDQDNNNDNENETRKNHQRSRPATQNDLLYSVESDESTIVDNLISDPQKLKEKLRQSKLEREQLSQLQQNYLQLLEQYAEAENFIDMFRLGGQPLIGIGAAGGTGGTAHPTPNSKMFHVNALFYLFIFIFLIYR